MMFGVRKLRAYLRGQFGMLDKEWSVEHPEPVGVRIDRARSVRRRKGYWAMPPQANPDQSDVSTACDDIQLRGD